MPSRTRASGPGEQYTQRGQDKRGGADNTSGSKSKTLWNRLYLLFTGYGFVKIKAIIQD